MARTVHARDIPPRDWEMVKDYERNGLSLRQIAADYKLSMQRVHQIMTQYGVEMRPPGASRRKG